MKVVIFFSLSKKKRSRFIASQFKGDLVELKPVKPITKIPVFRMLSLGFKTITDKPLAVIDPEIDFSQYEEVTLVFPIWAGRMCQYVKTYLQDIPFKNKRVRLVATSDSGKQTYKLELQNNVDSSNDVFEVQLYKKTTQL